MSTHSPRRRQILAYIRESLDKNGHSPSLEEIAAASGLKSRSAAQRHVRALQASGDLEVTAGKARSTRPKQAKSAAPGAAPLFEISSADVAALDDEDLRELVARLCMADLADADMPTTMVLWGGDQRAPDGGIDVRVRIPIGIHTRLPFRCAHAGLQVKATRMGVGDIRTEMCPGGMLRPSIQELIREKGAYIIAASDSVADGELLRRIDAMKSAASIEPTDEPVEFDYFDARRLADWTNRHPGVVAWVRVRLGRPLQGWLPHGQWADTRGGKPYAFLPDEANRLADPHERGDKFKLAEGLVHVRNLLRIGGSSVRLTGLSGVGKTRFAQALFEEGAAPAPLPPELAVYTDTSQSPNPPPLAVLDELLATGRRAILIVDNCASQLHNQLTARCKSSSHVSLLTVEYDIREDIPNETNVFHLEGGSPELIGKVVEQQFPHISQVNVATITRFADGNSRVAIALANTMDRNQSLAGLTDRDLFDRLFWLGKEVQHELMDAACACALVYSFNGEDMEGELVHLAALAEMSATSLFRHVSELERRGLAQRRGPWRAILPHAVANTLAVRALESVPLQLITKQLVAEQGRLLRSFSRRLGYLHESSNAVAIVRKWLSPGEILGDLANLTPLLAEVLTNVAPVDPDATISAIERAVKGSSADQILGKANTARTRIVRLVRSIAYEPEYFDRCMAVLLAFALAEDSDNRVDATRDVISSLFSLYLSGTCATTDQRLRWVRDLIEAPNPEVVAIGEKCLASALECHHFSSHYGFEFGARKRDYGWSPRGKAAQSWFAEFIALAAELARGGEPGAHIARDQLAQHFRSLWVAGMTDALEAAASPILENGWEKGWLAIRQTLRFDGKSLKAASRKRLRVLEGRAEPKSLIGQTKAIVLNGHSAGLEFADGESASSAYRRAEELARTLGEQVAVDREVFSEVLPLVVTNLQGRQWMFGEGLAMGAESIETCWDQLVDAFEKTREEDRSVQVLRGFLARVFERDRRAFERLLDAAMKRQSLVKWVPVLQLSGKLDDAGCARLLTLMDNPVVPSWMFQYLGHGRASDHLPDEALSELLQRLCSKQDGLKVALDVLSMHIFDNPKPIGPQLKQMARALLASAPLSRDNHHVDNALGRLVRYFLKGDDGEAAARDLLLAIRNGLEDYSLSKYGLTDTLSALAEVHPRIALDLLVGDEADSGDAYIRRRALAGGRRSSALSHVPIESIVSWCQEGSAERWAHVAPLVPAFGSDSRGGGLRWSDEAMTLLQSAPNPVGVAAALVDLIQPMSWVGSRAEAIKQRLPLLDQLEEVLGPKHEEQVSEWRARIGETVEREARRELEEHRARDERFE